MLGGHHFKRIRHRRPARAATDRPKGRTLLALLTHYLVEPFARIGSTSVHAVPIDLSGPEVSEDPSPNPGHPACAEHADSDYCRESWQLHLAELRRRPETHWHKCDYGMLCAIVPVVYQNRCIAAIKLACPASMPEKDFERQVELLDVLARDFVVSRADSLARLLRDQAVAVEPEGLPSGQGDERAEQHPNHPQVLRALQYIDEHLSDPGLAVSRIARELDIHPTYLSQLFADQVGQRMSRFIAARRVELAKTLLATTGWQVKRIAHETGHANPNWFCHVFSVHTGLTPGEYRRASHNQSPTDSNE